MVAAPRPSLPLVVGRYALYGEIASGGMATVHYGRLLGPVGFSRTVAIKRLHAQLAKDPDFVAMFLDEARLAARIRHPNVVPTLDVVSLDGELLLVMEYVLGESLAMCLRASNAARRPIPLEIVSAILCATLHGLHAAHEARDEHGQPLHIVHRDVSPQNVLVGADGVPRVLDFGVAKAAGRSQTTREGQLKGKLAYMAPEQLSSSGAVDRRTDIYAAGVVLWETLTRQRLFAGENEALVIRNALEKRVDPPSAVAGGVPRNLDAVTMRALDRDVSGRFATAREMALALEAAVPIASATRVAEWLDGLVNERIAQRAQAVAAIESHSGRMSAAENAPAPPVVALTASALATDRAVDAGTASQVSALSVASPTTPPRPALDAPRRWTRIMLAASAAMTLAAAALFARSGFRAKEPAPAAASQSNGMPSDAMSTASSSAAAPPAPVAPKPVLADDPVSSTAAAAPPVTSKPAALPPRKIAPPGAAPSAPCNVRAYIDESGIKHYVRDCK